MIVWLGFLLCVVREVVRETVFDVYSIYNMESISLCWSIHMLLYNTFKSKQQVCKEMITQGRIIVSCHASSYTEYKQSVTTSRLELP